MTCVKTGVYFTQPGDDVYTGDLFCVEGCWQIRGANRQPIPVKPDIVVSATAPFQMRAGTPYMDCPHVEMLAVTDKFRDHVRSWYNDHPRIMAACILPDITE